MDDLASAAIEAERTAKAVELRSREVGWGEVASQCGYPSTAAAIRAVNQALNDATERLQLSAVAALEQADLRYDRIISKSWQIIETDYVQTETRYAGETATPYEHTITSEAGSATVNLRGLDMAKRAIEAQAKLRGLDKKPEAEASEVQTVRIVGIDPSELI